MAMDAIMQVRMDGELKKQAEELYKSMGTSFSEAIRIFAKQSVVEKRMPFCPGLRTTDDYDQVDIDAILKQSGEDIAAGNVYSLQEFAEMMGEKYVVRKAI